jgi:hypothetical protein
MRCNSHTWSSSVVGQGHGMDALYTSLVPQITAERVAAPATSASASSVRPARTLVCLSPQLEPLKLNGDLERCNGA